MSLTASGRYRLFAISPSRPGFVIVLDAEGTYRLYVSKTGHITRKALDPDLVAALAEHPNWRVINDGRWYSLEDLGKVQTADRRQTPRDAPVVPDTAWR